MLRAFESESEPLHMHMCKGRLALIRMFLVVRFLCRADRVRWSM